MRNGGGKSLESGMFVFRVFGAGRRGVTGVETLSEWGAGTEKVLMTVVVAGSGVWSTEKKLDLLYKLAHL